MVKDDDTTTEQFLDKLVKSPQRTFKQKKSEPLRKRAERALKDQTADLQELSSKDVQDMIHELQVHQIELEMQNEELRRAQIELEESRNRYSDLYDFAPIGYFTFDKNGLIIGVNLTGAHKLNVERSFLIKKPFSLYIVPDSKDVFYLHLQQVFKTAERQTCELKLIDKNRIQFDAQLESMKVQDREGNSGLCRTAISDITERKHVGEVLRKAHDKLETRVQERTDELARANEDLQSEISEHRRAEMQIRDQASLLDKAQDAIAVRDLEHRLIYWNKGAERLYGWTEEEVMGRNADELLYKEESSRLIEAKKKVMEKGEWIGELSQLQKEGKEIIVESRWTLVNDDEGKQKSILIINTDITEKKKLELQYLRSQRMESIGTLAGGISHDINNLLTPIMLASQVLKERFLDKESLHLLNIIEKSSQRGANLIKQVMIFAQGVEGEHSPFQARHIIIEIEKITKETFQRNIEIRTDIQKDLFPIFGDSTQLHQVIMNLCVNARDAMQNGGILRITAENFFIDESYAQLNPEARHGPYIIITVSDTGTGIPAKILDRIFEPFFTTKEHGKGTGLGLSTTLGIVKNHGGFINVNSEVGKGTTFKIYLPAIETVETQKVEEQQHELHSGNGELILVIDDETQILESTRLMLETYGYKVITANDGAEAIAVYVKSIEDIKVVLLDMMMPIMDGHACIRAIRRVNPEAKIIAVSGLPEKDRLAKIACLTNAFLPKPYTAEKLLKTIFEVISEK